MWKCRGLIGGKMEKIEVLRRASTAFSGKK